MEIIVSPLYQVISPFSSSLLPPLLHLSTHCPHHTSSIHATKCYASVINKLPQGMSYQTAPQYSQCWLSSGYWVCIQYHLCRI